MVKVIHVVPQGVHHEDDDHGLCWCMPELDYIDPENGNKVYVHKDTRPGATH